MEVLTKLMHTVVNKLPFLFFQSICHCFQLWRLEYNTFPRINVLNILIFISTNGNVWIIILFLKQPMVTPETFEISKRTNGNVWNIQNIDLDTLFLMSVQIATKTKFNLMNYFMTQKSYLLLFFFSLFLEKMKLFSIQHKVWCQYPYIVTGNNAFFLEMNSVL